jgi:hypothetical protein
LSYRLKNTAIETKQRTELGLADVRGALQNRLEYQVQIGRRRTDDFENFGSGGELCQRLVTLAGELRDLYFLAGGG